MHLQLLLLAATIGASVNNPIVRDQYDGSGHFRERALAPSMEVAPGRIELEFEAKMLSGAPYQRVDVSIRVTISPCCTILLPADQVVALDPAKTKFRATWYCHHYTCFPQEFYLVMTKGPGLETTFASAIKVGSCCDCCDCGPCCGPRRIGLLRWRCR